MPDQSEQEVRALDPDQTDHLIRQEPAAQSFAPLLFHWSTISRERTRRVKQTTNYTDRHLFTTSDDRARTTRATNTNLNDPQRDSSTAETETTQTGDDVR